jgi:hypothetical protein
MSTAGACVLPRRSAERRENSECERVAPRVSGDAFTATAPILAKGTIDLTECSPWRAYNTSLGQRRRRQCV